MGKLKVYLKNVGNAIKSNVIVKALELVLLSFGYYA